MLRFLSKRRGRLDTKSDPKAGAQRLNPPNKNNIQCRVLLLDGTDLPIELSVSTYLLFHLGISLFQSSSCIQCKSPGYKLVKFKPETKDSCSMISYDLVGLQWVCNFIPQEQIGCEYLNT